MNVAIIGYGAMGHEIERVLGLRGHRVVLIIDQDNTSELNAQNLKQLAIDVAIEFSTPETAFGNVSKCLEAGIAVVCGTTGWMGRLPEIERLCQQGGGAFFYASNYSIGVNILFKINEMMAQLMRPLAEYDVTIEETHHTRKKDSPSGTAITLAEGIIPNSDRKSRWVNQTTTVPEELEITSIRRSTVPGTHTVTYESPVDLITITHSAKSREGFVLGAVAAAEFVYGKKGMFSMTDLLK